MLLHPKFNDIKHKITPEFLSTLSELARTYGWCGDYIEISAFVNDVYEELGLKAPELTPYDEIDSNNAITDGDAQDIQTPTCFTFDEIVNDLISRMSPEDRQSWMNVQYEDLIMGHHSTGRHIRNYYRLWEEGNPLCAGKHPDDVSMELMQAIWNKVHMPEMKTADACILSAGHLI